MASSSNAPTLNKNNTLIRLLRDLEFTRKESFEQLRKEKEQSDLHKSNIPMAITPNMISLQYQFHIHTYY